MGGGIRGEQEVLEEGNLSSKICWIKEMELTDVGAEGSMLGKKSGKREGGGSNVLYTCQQGSEEPKAWPLGEMNLLLSAGHEGKIEELKKGETEVDEKGVQRTEAKRDTISSVVGELQKGSSRRFTAEKNIPAPQG